MSRRAMIAGAVLGAILGAALAVYFDSTFLVCNDVDFQRAATACKPESAFSSTVWGITIGLLAGSAGGYLLARSNQRRA